MRLESLVGNQLLMAQAVFAMAEHIAGSTGYKLTPVTFAELPANPTTGMIGCVTDAALDADGIGVTGGGTYTLVVFYDGTDWLRVAGRIGGVVPLRPITFAQLPTSPRQGMLSCIIDSNRNGYGQIITASGPYIVLAFYDGTDWVVK